MLSRSTLLIHSRKSLYLVHVDSVATQRRPAPDNYACKKLTLDLAMPIAELQSPGMGYIGVLGSGAPSPIKTPGEILAHVSLQSSSLPKGILPSLPTSSWPEPPVW